MTARVRRVWKFRLGAFACAAALLLSLPAHAIQIKEVTSPKGIKGWLMQDSTVPLFTMDFAFRGGAALDPVGKEGLADFVSSLLDEGAGDMKSKEFQTKLEDNSISMDFNAGADYFSGSLEALSEYRDLAADLLHLALTKPRFDAAPVARIRSQYLSSVRRRAERPGYAARRAWKAAVFKDHPYGRELNGTEASFKSIDASDLKGFVAKRLARDVLVVAAVGDMDEATFGKLMDRAFGGLPPHAAARALPEAKIGGAGRVIVARRDVPQSIAIFGERGIERTDPDFYAASIINYVLGGGGLTSRLATEIREKRGLAYSVNTRLVTMEHAGLIVGRVATANARMAESLAIVRQQWAKIAKEGITANELRDAKSYLTGSFFTRLTSTGRIARTLLRVQLWKKGIDYLVRRNRLINAVTLEDARRVARRLFKPDELTISVAGSPAGVKPRP